MKITLQKFALLSAALFLSALGTSCAEEKKAETKEPAKEAKDEKEGKDEKKSGSTTVLIKTSEGDITVELNAEKAPATVKNFLAYVDAGHYTGTVFHRVIKDFMIQGGGFSEDLKQKKTQAPVKNEADNGLKNDEYTIAMARTPDPHSASSQFFINGKDNDFLNHTAKDSRGWGYCVFGKVTDGKEVVDKIEAVKTGPKGPFRSDVPVETITIKEIVRVK